jgi:membrane protein DedA with SNARE-associated domain
MLTEIISFIQSIIVPFGGWGILIGSFLEEIVFIIPSAIVQISGAFLLFEGVPVTVPNFLRFLITVPLPASLGVALGSIIVYWIAYSLGKPAILKFGKYFGVTWEHLESLEQRFEKRHYDLVIVFFGRFIPAIPGPVVSTFAGLMRIPFLQYFIVSVFGTFLRATMYGFIGWQVGSLYFKNEELIKKFEIWIFSTLIVLLVIFILYKQFRKKVKIRQDINRQV